MQPYTLTYSFHFIDGTLRRKVWNQSAPLWDTEQKFPLMLNPSALHLEGVACHSLALLAMRSHQQLHHLPGLLKY